MAAPRDEASGIAGAYPSSRGPPPVSPPIGPLSGGWPQLGRYSPVPEMTAQIRVAGVFLLLVVSTTAAGAADVFLVGGLSLNSTVEDVRRLYPHSLINDHHVEVLDQDVRENIWAIRLPRAADSHPLRMFFRRLTEHRPTYPPCGQVLASIERKYGAPANVQEFGEERAWTRRHIWPRGGEVLTLLCFRLGRGALSASEITIAPR